MPRMIDDELMAKVIESYELMNEACGGMESGWLKEELDALRSAPSVELLDLGKVETKEVLLDGYFGKTTKMVRFSDLQSIVVPSRWIPIAERLPDNDEYCLVCDADSVWESQWFGYWCDEVDLTPTHWQPLPLPPGKSQ